jgi:integrase
VQRVQKRAGVVSVDAEGTTRAKATFRGLRHTSATSMLLSDKPLAVVVARQLGHGSTRVTAASYEHLGLLDDSLLDDALGVFT